MSQSPTINDTHVVLRPGARVYSIAESNVIVVLRVFVAFNWNIGNGSDIKSR